MYLYKVLVFKILSLGALNYLASIVVNHVDHRLITAPPNTFFFLENALKKLLNIFPNSFFYLKVQFFRLIMENKFIKRLPRLAMQQAKRSIQFLKTLLFVCSCISPMASRILSFKASIVSGFDSIPLIIVQRCQIAAPRWPNISFAADNVILKNRAQNIECGKQGRSIETKCCQYPPLHFFVNSFNMTR